MSSRRRATRVLARLALAVGLAASAGPVVSAQGTWPVAGGAVETTPQVPSVANGTIAFVSGRDSALPKIFTMGANGSSLTCLMCSPPGADPRTGNNPAWSPDGTKILFDRDFHLWVMNPDGSGQVELTDEITSSPITAIKPAWSADGRRIAFSAAPSSDWEVFVADLILDTNGSPIQVRNQINLSNDPGLDMSATWNASGRVAWSSNRSGNNEIYISDATAGAAITNLTNNPAEDYAPDFSTDGQRIVFGSTRDASPTGEIYVMDASGANVRRLSTNTSSDGEPAFSPDGTRIVFQRFLPAGLDIFVMDATDANSDGIGDNETNLNNDADGDTSPDWQPVPKRLLFETNRDASTPKAFTMTPLGGDPRCLVCSSDPSGKPKWSPDGLYVAFSRNGELWVSDRTGATVLPFTDSGSNHIVGDHPTWAPGTSPRRLAFERNISAPGTPDYEIFVMDVTALTGSAATVTTPVNITQTAGNDRRPSWGSTNRIAFQSSRAGNSEIFVMDPSAGAAQTNITNHASADSAPDWSPDGQLIVFVSLRDVPASGELYIMKADGTPPDSGGLGPRRITNDTQTDDSPSWSTDGSRIAFQSFVTGSYDIFAIDAADGANRLNLTGHPGAADLYPDWEPEAVAAASADIAITLGTTPAAVAVGQLLSYDVEVTNNGPQTATTIVVTSTLPAGVTFNNSSPICSVASGVVTCTVASLASGAKQAMSWRVIPQATGNLANTATVAAAEADPNAANNQASVNTTVTAAMANMVIFGNKPSSPVAVNQNVDVSFTVRNAGPSPATGVMVDVDLPSNVSVVEVFGPGCVTTASHITCAFGTLADGAQNSLGLRLRASGDSDYTIDGAVQATEPDPDADNNDASAKFTVQRTADLKLTLTGPPVVTVDREADYVFLVQTTGVTTSRGVRVNYRLPDDVTLDFVQPAKSGDFGCTVNGRDILCEFPEVFPGGLAGKVRVRHNKAKSFLHEMTTSSLDTFDPTTFNNTASVLVKAGADADLQLSMRAPAQATQGQLVTFQMDVRNGGPFDALGVFTGANLPNSLEFSSVSATTATCTYDAADRNVFCYEPLMAPFGTQTFSLTVRPTESGVISLTGVTFPFWSSTTDGDLSNNLATATTTACTAGGTRLAFNSQPPLLAAVGQEYIYGVRALDPSGRAVTYALGRGPAGMTIDPGTGVLSWTPPASAVSTAVVVTVVASNGTCNGTVQQPFSINVGQAGGFTLDLGQLRITSEMAARVSADGTLLPSQPVPRILEDGTWKLGGDTQINQFLRISGDITVTVNKAQDFIDFDINQGGVFLTSLPLIGNKTLWEGGRTRFRLNGSGLLSNFSQTQDFIKQLEVAGVTIGGINARVLFAEKGLLLSGKLEMFPGVFTAEVGGIEISQANGIRVTGTIPLPDFNLGPFKVKNTRLSFFRGAAPYLDGFEGSGDLEAPGFGVGGRVKVLGGSLESIGARLSGVSVPLPPVLTITGGSVDVGGFQTGQFQLALSVDVTIANAALSRVISLSRAGINMSSDRFLGSSDLEILTYKVAEAGLEIITGGSNKSIEFSTSVHMLESFPVLIGSLDLGGGVRGGSPFFNAKAALKVQIPGGSGFIFDLLKFLGARFPIVLGQTQVAFRYPPGEFSFNYNVANFGNVAVVVQQAQSGARVLVGKNLSELVKAFGSGPVRYDGRAAHAAVQQTQLRALGRLPDPDDPLTRHPLYIPAASVSAPSQVASVTVTSGTEVVAFRLYSPNGAPRYSLIPPVGTTLTPDNAAANSATFGQVAETGESFFIVPNPAAGGWVVEAEDAAAGPFVLDAIGGNAAPTLASVTATPGAGSAAIGYTASDPDSDATVSLFYDNDQDGFNGTLFAENLPEGAAGSFNWITNDGSIPSGEYYVYAVVDDGVNDPVMAYAGAKVTVVDPTAPGMPQGVTATRGAENTLNIAWAANPDANLAGYQVRYGLDEGDATTFTGAVDAGNSLTRRLVGLQNNAPYRVILEAYSETTGGDGAVERRYSLPSAVATAITGAAIPPLVQVTTPNGGERLTNDTLATISWTVDQDDIIDQQVDLSLDNGTTWNTLRRKIDGAARNYVWDVPGSLASATALVRVTVVDRAGNQTADTSDTAFALGTPPGTSADPIVLILSSTNSVVGEASGPATVSVIRLGDPSVPVMVTYATSDGTANEGVDYTATAGVLAFATGETIKTLTIPIVNDTTAEPNETIAVSLGAVTAGVLLGSPTVATVDILDDDGDVPTVTIISPTTAATYTGSTPVLTLAGTAADNLGIVSVSWTSDRGGAGPTTGTTSWVANVPLLAGANVITVRATDADGNVGTDTLTVTVNAFVYTLTEGATGSFFDSYALLANPSDVDAPVTVTLVHEGTPPVSQSMTLAPRSRTTLRFDDAPGGAAVPTSAIVTSTAAVPLVVERAMYWDGSYTAGHAASIADQARTQWYFAEGSQGFFDTFLLLGNLNTSDPAHVIVTFLLEDGTTLVRTYTIAPAARLNVATLLIPGLAGRSFGMIVDATQPVTAERAMYFGGPSYSGGLASAGIPEPSTRWLHAEGATGSQFDTYLLLLNPNAAPSDVTVLYALASDATITRTYVVPPLSRVTVFVDNQAPELAAVELSMLVTSTLPIVSERSMYWPGGFPQWVEGHNSAGLREAGTRWGLAEGVVGGPLGFSTWLIVFNADQALAADVRVTFLRTDGTTVVKTFTLAALSRRGMSVAELAPELLNESFGLLVEATNGAGIVVERSTYWGSTGTFARGGTNATAVRLP